MFFIKKIFPKILILSFIITLSFFNKTDLLAKNGYPDLKIESIQFYQDWNGFKNVLTAKICNQGKVVFNGSKQNESLVIAFSKDNVSKKYFYNDLILNPHECTDYKSHAFVNNIDKLFTKNWQNKFDEQIKVEVDQNDIVYESQSGEKNNILLKKISFDFSKQKNLSKSSCQSNCQLGNIRCNGKEKSRDICQLNEENGCKTWVLQEYCPNGCLDGQCIRRRSASRYKYADLGIESVEIEPLNEEYDGEKKHNFKIKIKNKGNYKSSRYDLVLYINENEIGSSKNSSSLPPYKTRTFEYIDFKPPGTHMVEIVLTTYEVERNQTNHVVWKKFFVDTKNSNINNFLNLSLPEKFYLRNGTKVTQNGAIYENQEIDKFWCLQDNNTQGSGPFKFEWGDGQVSCSYFPGKHLYRNNGIYEILVSVKNIDGSILEKTSYIEINNHFKRDSYSSIQKSYFDLSVKNISFQETNDFNSNGARMTNINFLVANLGEQNTTPYATKVYLDKKVIFADQSLINESLLGYETREHFVEGDYLMPGWHKIKIILRMKKRDKNSTNNYLEKRFYINP